MSTLYNEKVYLYSGVVGIYFGQYELWLDEYDTSLIYIPDGYEFVGWYCPALSEDIFILDAEVADVYRYYIDEMTSTELTFTAIVRKPQYVTYIVDYEYSFNSFRNQILGGIA